MHHCDMADIKKWDLAKKVLTDQEVVENVVHDTTKTQAVDVARKVLE